MKTPAIKVKNLTQTFYEYEKDATLWQMLLSPKVEKRALDDISFMISKGSSLGVIGRSGSGKSILQKVLAGYIRGTQPGSVELLGKNWRDNDNELTGSVRHISSPPIVTNELTPEQQIKFYNSLFGKNGQHMLGVDDLVPMFGMQEFYTRKIGNLSLGERVRTDLAGTLAAGIPEILLLDEITNGLDDLLKHDIRGILNDLRKEFGMAVVMTSHDLDDIEAVCGHVLVLDKGKNVAKKGNLVDCDARVGNLINVKKWTNNGQSSLKEKVISTYESFDRKLS